MVLISAILFILKGNGFMSDLGFLSVHFVFCTPDGSTRPTYVKQSTGLVLHGVGFHPFPESVSSKRLCWGHGLRWRSHPHSFPGYAGWVWPALFFWVSFWRVLDGHPLKWRCVVLLLPPIEVRKNLTERQNSPRTRWYTDYLSSFFR